MLELATQAYPLTLMGAALGFPDQQDLAATLEVDKAIRMTMSKVRSMESLDS